MKNHIKWAYACIVSLMTMCINGCGKDFLDVKRDQRLIVPTKLKDFQSLMDNASANLNYRSSHELGVIGSDEYALLDGRWATMSSPYMRNGYIWAQDVYEGNQVADWNNAYNRILYANLTLEGLAKIEPDPYETADYNNVKGIALFHRAFNHYQLAQLFCKPYDAASASKDSGIPLKMESDITLKITRASVDETYQQIISDLVSASGLLFPQQITKMRPSSAAAFALLAKTYLLMGNYQQAGHYADLALDLYDEIIDFNTLDLNAEYTFPYDYGNSNPEIIFMDCMQTMTNVATARINVSQDLINLYEKPDLRKPAFFRKNESDGRIIFKGSYFNFIYFTGLTTTETCLIRAESAIRNGQTELALNELNRLLRYRYDRLTFQQLSGMDDKPLLSRILEERRKELILRGTRWEDLRRLNKEPEFAKTIVRNIDGQHFELSPNDQKYVWPLPDNVISLSGLSQNPR